MKNIDWRDLDTYLVWVIGTMFFFIPFVSIVAIWGGMESLLAIRTIMTAVIVTIVAGVIIAIRN